MYKTLPTNEKQSCNKHSVNLEDVVSQPDAVVDPELSIFILQLYRLHIRLIRPDENFFRSFWLKQYALMPFAPVLFIPFVAFASRLISALFQFAFKSYFARSACRSVGICSEPREVKQDESDSGRDDRCE